LFFVAAGAAVFHFLGGFIRSRGGWQYMDPILAIWLLLVAFFLSLALTSGALAWLLARRRPIGYYGSLLTTLFLVLVGPIVSLVQQAPDFLLTASLTLLPILVMILTLSSIAAFENGAHAGHSH